MNTGISIAMSGLSRQVLPCTVLSQFLRVLADLLSAGIDLPAALQTTAGLMGHKGLRNSCTDQAEALLQGSEWPDVLRDSLNPVWPAILIAWTGVGIRTGALVDCLNCLHREWQDTLQLRQELTRRLSYPVGVLILALALTWFTGAQFQSDAMQAMLLTGTVLLAATGIGIHAAYTVIKPGGLNEARCWSRCLHALALCARAGLSWPQSLNILLHDLQDLWRGHRRIGEALQACHDNVVDGMALSTAAEVADLPETLQRSLRLAEMTGDMPAALAQAASLSDILQRGIRNRLIAILPAAALALAGLTLAIQYALFIQPLYAQLGAT